MAPVAKKAKRKTYEVEVSYTIVVSGHIDVMASSEEEAEKIAHTKLPEISWNVPDGWDSNETIDVEVLDSDE